jgi:hypothetical protein
VYLPVVYRAVVVVVRVLVLVLNHDVHILCGRIVLVVLALCDPAVVLAVVHDDG